MIIVFVGQAGDSTLLAGVGMGSMLINIFCLATSEGLNGTIETFVARDFGAGNKATEEGDDQLAANKYKACGFHLNRARVIVFLALLPFCLASFWTDSILIALQ